MSQQNTCVVFIRYIVDDLEAIVKQNSAPQGARGAAFRLVRKRKANLSEKERNFQQKLFLFTEQNRTVWGSGEKEGKTFFILQGLVGLVVARFLEWRGTTGSPEGLRQETRQLGRGPLPSTKVCLAQRAEARGTLDEEGATMGNYVLGKKGAQPRLVLV